MPRTGERGGPQTRAKILAASTRLFLERGYDAVTVAEVAREAGVSSVTVFNHFPRKEDLFLDRAVDAVELLQAAVRERPPGTDVLTSLRATTLRLFDARHPLSGVNDRSVPFFRTVAASPALVARAREIASDLQQTLAEELARDPGFEGDETLLAAFFIAGYSAVMVATARRLVAGEQPDDVVDEHRVRLERLFDALRHGVAPCSGGPAAGIRATASVTGSDTSGRTVLGRAFAVLDSFSEGSPEQSLGAIAKATGLPPATVHRVLAALVGWGAVERTGRGRYRIGLHLWRLGSLAPQGRELRDVALPYLQDLLEVTHEVVHLVVLDENQALYLERLESRPGVAVVSQVGGRLPLHATGPGKVLLAHAPGDVLDQVLHDGLRRHARRTVTDPGELRRVLAEIRRTGHSFSRDEMTDGASSVAAPVTDADGRVIAAISVVVPSRSSLLPLVAPVRLAALGISRELGRRHLR